MQIVALDTFVTEFEGIDWTPFESIGDFIKFDRSTESQIIERSYNAQAIITNKVVFNRNVIKALPELRYIGVFATGINCVDLEAAREKDIAVTNVPAYSTDSVAQHVFSFILTEFSPILPYNQIVKAGTWSASPDFCCIQFVASELAGKTLGIIGYGNIGRKVAEIAKAFSMQVLIYSKHLADSGPEYKSLREVLSKSDVISLHCALSPSTEKIINSESIQYINPQAVLINTSRGGLIDEECVAAALREKRLKRFYTDVLNVEPPNDSNLLVYEPNCIITPHVAWASHEARQRLLNEAAENLRAFKAGLLRNRVDL